MPLVSLDDYFDAHNRIALLKIDVEGAELGVFKGAERILAGRYGARRYSSSNARIAISRRALSAMCFPILRALAIRAASSGAIRFCPISQFDAAVHQRQDGEWFWKRKDYCNNFVFRKTPEQQ